MAPIFRFFFLIMLLTRGISPCSVVKDPTSCPYATFSSPEGSSVVVAANLSSASNMLALHKWNSSGWEDILIIINGQVRFVNDIYSGCFYISDGALIINNTGQDLTGDYRVVCDLDGACVQQFSFLDLTSSPSATISSPEGSSMVVDADLSSDNSSGRQEILITNKGQVNFVDVTYRGHFYISDDALVINSAGQVLTGDYRVVCDSDGACMQQFPLKITGSEAPGNFTYLIIGVSVIAILALCVGIYVCRRLSCLQRLKFGTRQARRATQRENVSLEAGTTRESQNLQINDVFKKGCQMFTSASQDSTSDNLPEDVLISCPKIVK